MESSAVLRSFHWHRWSMTVPLKFIFEKPGSVLMNNAALFSFGKYPVQGLAYSGKLISSPNKFGGVILSCVKTADVSMTSKPDDLGDSKGAVMSDSCEKDSVEKNSPRRATFPDGFKELVKEVCDNTQIAELKLKVGDFEMNLKRNIGPTIAPPPVVESPTVAPPIPTEPMNESATPAPQPSQPKQSAEKASPFTNVAAEKSAKLADLDSSGASGYVLVSSPTVGSFRRGRTLKGKKQPPIVKEGDVIKEGQIIGFLDQFGTELPVKSNVAGEVLKILFQDGEAVGYGDPLVAIIPSFHGIK